MVSVKHGGKYHTQRTVRGTGAEQVTLKDYMFLLV